MNLAGKAGNLQRCIGAGIISSEITAIETKEIFRPLVSLEVGEIREDIFKRRLFYAAITGMFYVMLYGICRYFFDIGQQFYMYTPSWTLRNVLWLAAPISIIPSLFGNYRFSIITLAGYILGIVTGELFGGFKSHMPPEYPHYGWIIWGFVYISSAIIGIKVTRRK